MMAIDLVLLMENVSIQFLQRGQVQRLHFQQHAVIMQ